MFFFTIGSDLLQKKGIACFDARFINEIDHILSHTFGKHISPHTIELSSISISNHQISYFQSPLIAILFCILSSQKRKFDQVKQKNVCHFRCKNHRPCK